MTNALLGYILGNYYIHHGTFADLNELFLQGYSLADFRTREVDRFLAIQQLVDQHDLTTNKAFVALRIQLAGLFECLPEEELPFYFLPLAYLRGATFEEVMKLTADLVTTLTQTKEVTQQVLCLVGAIKWSLTTQCSYFPWVYRCFPTILDDVSSPLNLVGEVLTALTDSGLTATCLDNKARSEVPFMRKLRQACQVPAHAAIRCALAYALMEVESAGEYSPSMALGAAQTDQAGRNDSPSLLEDFSVPFPLHPRLTTQLDAHIEEGYERLDGYIAWQMKPKREPLLTIAILGDAFGPDRESLRFWNFCNKHLDWEQLAGEVDDFFSKHSWLSDDWRDTLKGHEIQWYRQRVAFLLNTGRCLSFTPDYRSKSFKIDEEEAGRAGYPKFHFLPDPNPPSPGNALLHI